MASYDGARTLGQYQLLSQLAVGGMAEIYVARTGGVGGFEKLVALKVIHPNFSADPEFVQMLVDEAKLSVQLQHANIVQTFDLGRVDEQYYIAMELIDGVDLYKLLRRASEHDVDFPFEVAAFICAEVCAGLDYAHRKRDSRGRPLKIVHRDVSPQNILVSYDGEVKIVDFGIAKAAMRTQNTAAGVIKGKYYYMSPEQAWGDPIDARTDIFSGGILLYEMIVGQMLYMEEDIDKLLEIVRKAAIAPPSSKRMGVPRELEQILMRALKKRADDRWPSAGELGTALTQFVHGFAPDFNRSRLATFVREVMGDDPTAQRRDPRQSTAAARGNEDVRDENSLLFKLRNLPPREPPAPPPAREPASPPRRADVATNVGPSRAELEPQRLGKATPQLASEFEESEATIVDSKGETLLAFAHEANESDPTRTASPRLSRGTKEAPSGRFDLGNEDPAKDHDLDAPTVDQPRKPAPAPRLDLDEDDVPTGSRRLPPGRSTREMEPVDERIDEDDDEELRLQPPQLPGVREAKPTPLGVRHRQAPAPAPIEEESTGKRQRPTLEMRRPPRPGEEGDAPAGASGDEPRDDIAASEQRPTVAERNASGARPQTPQPRPRVATPAATPRSLAPARRDETPLRAPGTTDRAANSARPPTPVPPTLRPQANAPIAPQANVPTQPMPQNPPSPLSTAERRSPTGPQQQISLRERSPSGAQPILKTVPQVGSEAATLALPPGMNPVSVANNVAPLQPVKPGQTHKQSFDEPTKIPPAQPPPIDSGSQWPTIDDPPYGSPLADPAELKSRKRSPLVYIVVGGTALLTALVVGALTLGGDSSARGALSIVSTPSGAEVRIDGNASAQPTPVTLNDVDPRQTHHLRVSKGGYDVWESDVRFPAGARNFSVQAVLMPAVGTVEITSTPTGAEAIVNGRIRGMTPTTVGDLPPNDDVVIELRLRGYKVAHKTVSWSGRRLIQLSIPLEKAKF